MSLILDALNKAQSQQDAKNTVPHIGSYSTAIKPIKHQVPYWILYAIALLLLCIVIGLGVIIFRGIPSIKPSLSLVEAPLMVSHLSEGSFGEHGDVSRVIAANPSEVDSAAIDTQHISAEGLMVIDSTESSVLSNEVASIYQKHSHKTDTQKSPISDVSALYSQKAISEANQNKEGDTNERYRQSATSVDELWEQVQNETKAPEPKSEQKRFSTLPFLHELPESFQDRIPTLMYQNHIFSTKASAVVLNGQTYRKGAVIAPDLVVEEITENDLILSYLSKPFRLAALSSWVKMN